MRCFQLAALLVAAAVWGPHLAAAAGLRGRPVVAASGTAAASSGPSGAAHSATVARAAGKNASGAAAALVASGAPHRHCAGRRGQGRLGLLGRSLRAPTQLGQDGGVFMDGFSRVACEVDEAPAPQRIYFKDHACGGVPTCRLTEMPMQPRLCFDFCRQFEDAKFFGIRHGGECYCSRYFHAKSLGGEGTCDIHCEGDADEMCGGTEKSSLFEMHMCADSESEATVAGQLETAARGRCDALLQAGNSAISKLLALGDAWQLDVCSLAPEGPRACDLKRVWIDQAARLQDTVAGLQHIADVMTSRGGELVTAVQAAGTAATAEAASGMELATDALRDAVAKASGKADAANLTLASVAGPLGGGVAPLANFADVFKPLGDVGNGWHAVCALVPIPGEAYAAVTAEDNPAACGARCLSLSTGTGACAAFNYQYRDSLASCQLLSGEGLVEPADSLLKAVPIFEVSTTKRDAMGLASLGCYAHGAFVAGHPRGPLGTKVVKEVVSK